MFHMKHLHYDAKHANLQILPQGLCSDKSPHGVQTFYDAIETEETIQPIKRISPKQKFCSTYACNRACSTNGECIESLASNISLIFIANVENQEFVEKLKNTKARCYKERQEAETNQHANAEVKSLLSEMMGAVNYNNNQWK